MGNRYFYVLFTLVFLTIRTYAGETNDESELAESFGEPNIVSVATGSPQDISRAPAVASVITAAQIKEMGATTLDEVLETVPGIHVSESSERFNPVISIDGISSDTNPEVLVLVDGMPITQVYEGNRGARSDIPVADIERIEVIRGPGSALYGADAFSGVINVITKQASDMPGTEIGARYGSYDTREVWLNEGTNWSGFNIAASLDWYDTLGDDNLIIQSDAQTLFDDALGTHASRAPGPASTQEQRIDAHLDIQRGDWHARFWDWTQYDIGVGPGLALALDPSGQGDTSNYLADLIYHPSYLPEHWDVTTQFRYMDINTHSDQTLFPAGAVLPIGNDGNIDPASHNFVSFPDGVIGNPAVYEQHSRFELNTFYTGFQEHRLHLGMGIEYDELTGKESKNYGPGVLDVAELQAAQCQPVDISCVPSVSGAVTNVTGTPDVFIKPEERTNYFAYLQDEWSLARDWALTYGLRYDDYSDFGSTVNPRVALVWQTAYPLTTKLLFGRAFRAPSFAELYTMNNPIRVGNPNLKPETIDTTQLAFDYQVNFQLNTKLNLFYYQIGDQISLVTTTDGASYTSENTGNQRGQGLEWEFTWKFLSDLQLNGNYSLQTVTSTSSDASPDAPQHMAYLGLDWKPFNNWSLYSQAKWIGQRDRAVGDLRPPLPGYTEVDITLRRVKIMKNWEAAISIRNLFNADAKEPSPYSAPTASIPDDFPLPGRNGYAEIRYTF